MCEKQNAKSKPQGWECQNPDECKGHPWECSPEQIKKCHGDVKEHPCVKPAAEK